MGIAMYVTYFDEVKAIPENGQDRYWVGGICVPMQEIGKIEAKLNDLSQDVFGTKELSEATEFHATAIYFGKFPTRNWKMSKRLEILDSLYEILTECDAIKRVYASINSKKLYAPEKAGEYAFAHFCERTQMLVGKKGTTMLIGDMDAHKNAQTIKEFSQYRIEGTPWEYGIKINSIVDCVHFAHSHHSRMIQLADFYLFVASHNASGRSGDMAIEFDKILNKADCYAHRYKWWPN
jgi:hypothetical protein